MAEGKSGGGSNGMLLVILFVVAIGLYDTFTGGSTFGVFTGNNNSSGGPYTAPTNKKEIQQELYRISEETDELKKQTELDKRIGSLSPIAKQIRLSAVGIWAEDPTEEYVELEARSSLPKKNVTYRHGN